MTMKSNTNTDIYVQIFVYNTNIKLNFPIIKFLSKQELVEFIGKLNKTNSDKYNGYPTEAHFVINNSHLLPNDLVFEYSDSDSDCDRYTYYPIETNLDLLMSKISFMSNGANEFIDVLKNWIDQEKIMC